MREEAENGRDLDPVTVFLSLLFVHKDFPDSSVNVYYVRHRS